MTTKSIGAGFKPVASKSGKVIVVKRAPRMAPVLASAKHKQAARLEKKWKAKSK